MKKILKIVVIGTFIMFGVIFLGIAIDDFVQHKNVSTQSDSLNVDTVAVDVNAYLWLL